MAYRDQINHVENSQLKVKGWYRPYTESNPRYDNVYNRPTQTALSVRSTSTPTSKDWLKPGAYYLPTFYEAFRFTSGGIPHDPPKVYKGWGSWQDTYTDGIPTSQIAWFSTYNCSGYYPHNPIVRGAIVGRCASKVQNAIRNQDWNLGQTIGEMPETLKSLEKPFRQLLDVLRTLRAAKKGDVKALAKRMNWWKTLPRKIKRKLSNPTLELSVDDIAAIWLALEFGVKPIISDILTGLKILRDGLSDDSPLTVTRVQMDEEFSVSNMPFSGTVLNHLSVNGIEMSVTFAIADPGKYTLERYGVTNLLGLAWELLPLSFVINWFIPIGNFLSALTQPAGIHFKHGYTTRFQQWQATLFAGQAFDSAGIRGSQRASVRIPLITFPIPAPFWDPRLNPGKLLSMAALIVALR